MGRATDIMAVDRAAIVQRADQLLRQGKLELAIAEYAALVRDQPGDLGAANTLGDLYARHGDTGKAIEQFTRLAESERSQGFLSKAVALYKKALKVDPGCELALSQLADIAVGQELLADATLYWNRLLQCQRSRNDDVGVAGTLIQLASLPVAKADTKLVAARAAERHAPQECAHLFADAARTLERESRPGEAVDAWVEAAQRSEDMEILRAAALACVRHGAAERAAPFLTLDVAGEDPALREVLGIPAAPDAEAAALTAEPSSASAGEEAVESPEPAALSTVAPWVDVVAEAGDGSEIDVLAALEEATFEEPEPLAPVTPQVAMPVDAPASAEANAPVVPPVLLPAPRVVEAPWPPPAPSVAPAMPTAEVSDTWAEADDAPLDDEALIAQLEVAAGTPALQFQATAQLGRLFIQRGQLDRGVDWLRRASRAQAPVRDHGLAVLYDLAEALERLGREDQALAVWSDLEFDAGAYRDVAERLARLNRRRASGQ